MNIQELGAELKARGMKGPQRSPIADGTIFWRQIKTEAPCLCNDKLQLTLHAHDISLGIGARQQTLSMDITGEYRQGVWASLKVYALSWEMGLQDLDKIEGELHRAWIAMYGAVNDLGTP